MNRRAVKPPPRVTPQIATQETQSAASPQKSKISSEEDAYADYTKDPDFESLVQLQMAKMQLELEEIARQERQGPPNRHLDIADDLPKQKYQSPSRNPIDMPQEMYGQGRADLFDHQDHYSLSPRRAKGGLSELYGPDDDRQNLKAAKAAAYSHQVSFFLS
jgi:hypothetical protein